MSVFARQHDLGAVSGPDSTMRMRTGRVRLPDIAFVSKHRLPSTRQPIPTLAPDLAVEVLSESNTAAEIKQKLQDFFQSGTQLAWIVDPDSRTVAVHHSPDAPDRILQETDQLDGGSVLPGF